MSDVLRNYSWGGNPRKRRRDLRRRAGRVGGWVLVAAALLLAAALWTTRNSHDMGGLVPADGAVHASVDEIMRKRDLLARSRIWDLFPEESAARGAAKAATGELPVPEWLLNNLSTGVSHWVSPRLDDFSEVLLVTRMTRIGCLAAKLSRFLPGIEGDHAGGLRLCKVADAGLYYAVRGRILLASPSRRALVHALTLDGKEALGEGALKAWVAGATGADLFGRIDPATHALLSGWFDRVEFTLRVAPEGASAAVRAHLNDGRRGMFAAQLQGVSPQRLTAPPSGPLALSASLGLPLREALPRVAAVMGREAAVAAFLEAPAPDTAAPWGAFAGLARAVLLQAGSGLRLSWRGMDVDEMVPVPLVVATVDGGAEALAALRESPPAPPKDNPEIDWIPRVEPETGIIHVPLVGGPSIEPTFAEYGGGVLVSSSLDDARAVLGGAPPETIEQSGNLYLSMRPDQVMDAVGEAGSELATFGFLRDHTPESFLGLLVPWREIAAKINVVSLLAGYESDELQVSAWMQMQ